MADWAPAKLPETILLWRQRLVQHRQPDQTVPDGRATPRARPMFSPQERDNNNSNNAGMQRYKVWLGRRTCFAGCTLQGAPGRRGGPVSTMSSWILNKGPTHLKVVGGSVEHEASRQFCGSDSFSDRCVPWPVSYLPIKLLHGPLRLSIFGPVKWGRQPRPSLPAASGS